MATETLTTADILRGSINLIDQGYWEPGELGYCGKPGCALGLVHMAAGLDYPVLEGDEEVPRGYPMDVQWSIEAMNAVCLLSDTADLPDDYEASDQDRVIDFNDDYLVDAGAARSWFERALARA